jgi:hypothetical protein
METKIEGGQNWVVEKLRLEAARASVPIQKIGENDIWWTPPKEGKTRLVFADDLRLRPIPFSLDELEAVTGSVDLRRSLIKRIIDCLEKPEGAPPG